MNVSRGESADELELVELQELRSQDQAELEGDELDPYETEGLGLTWRPKDLYVAIRSRGRLIAAAGLLRATVEVDGIRIDVVGLGDVIVERSHRGHGYGRIVIELALNRAKELGPRFALLFCDDVDARLYRTFGFTEIDTSVVVGQPAGRVELPLIAMSKPLKPDLRWPAGPVAVVGLPF